MQLRYSFRLYPNGPQRAALAQAFGCARVVYNDALQVRETARAGGAALPKTGDLSKLLITEAKKTEERAWLGGVSAVVLQQSLRNLDAAYRNFFDGLKGKRPRVGAPRYKSRKDNRQAVRRANYDGSKLVDLTPGSGAGARYAYDLTLSDTSATVTAQEPDTAWRNETLSKLWQVPADGTGSAVRVSCNRGEQLFAAADGGQRVVWVDGTTGWTDLVTRERPAGQCG
ncbi:helix-turn-helix domain-containing protein [Streptomyces beijiangensis]|uniref:helix-turn-helix domain-containing protein n=1 Tax=Streptomyces beijiangensis TaxID=163361 RepID=UPI003558AF51